MFVRSLFDFYFRGKGGVETREGGRGRKSRSKTNSGKEKHFLEVKTMGNDVDGFLLPSVFDPIPLLSSSSSSSRRGERKIFIIINMKQEEFHHREVISCKT